MTGATTEKRIKGAPEQAGGSFVSFCYDKCLLAGHRHNRFRPLHRSYFFAVNVLYVKLGCKNLVVKASSSGATFRRRWRSTLQSSGLVLLRHEEPVRIFQSSDENLHSKFHKIPLSTRGQIMKDELEIHDVMLALTS